MHAFEDAKPQTVEQRVQYFAARVLRRIKNPSPEALMAHLHDVLFQEEGFVGARESYYSPLNSYLPQVLETRQGIPITLALVYKLVGERIGLEVEGVNAPGHFLVRVRDSRGWLLIDPYHGGAVLSPHEAFFQVQKILGHAIRPYPGLFAGASHGQWLARILTNLENTFKLQGCRNDLAAVKELQTLLASTSSD
jgi:regulator of sirC expression with transglutaminase-like and TPR domain